MNVEHRAWTKPGATVDGLRPFVDRRDAGAQLADLFGDHDFERPIVLALPRGGVPVAAAVAETIEAPLDVWVARKVGAPRHEEYGIGAVAEGGGAVIDRRSLDALSIDDDEFEELVARELAELERRVDQYRRGRPRPDLEGRDVLLVDDGLATGVTAEAAVRAVAGERPRSLIVAVPVAAADSFARLSEIVEVVAVIAPTDFVAVGKWYLDFWPTSDDEVVRLLDAARRRSGTEP